MSGDKRQDAIDRAHRAQTLIKDELLSECLGKLEAEYIAAWRLSPARDTDGRERLWQAVQIVGKVKDHLVKVLNDGKLAQAEINAMLARDKAA